jgi:hypothetical protein
MIAVIDETAPEGPRGIYYVVTAAIVIAEPAMARAALAAVLPAGRERPFHWRREGPDARDALFACIEELGVVSHVCVHYPTGRQRQEKARAAGLKHVVCELLVDGADELIIESRTANDDRRDQVVILDTLRELGHVGGMSYKWRPKAEQLLWIADGICGAVRQHLLGEDDSPFKRLQEGDNLGELVFLAEAPTPKLRKSRLPS